MRRSRTHSSIFPNILNEVFNVIDQSAKDTSSTYNKRRVPVNVKESDKAFIIEVVAPGLSKEAFNIKIEEQVLRISYTAPEAQETEESVVNIRSEYSIQEFERAFTIPKKVDLNNINANYNAGILEITLAKKPEDQISKTITVE